MGRMSRGIASALLSIMWSQCFSATGVAIWIFNHPASPFSRKTAIDGMVAPKVA